MRWVLAGLMALALPAALEGQQPHPGLGGALAIGIAVNVEAFGAAATGTGDDGQLLTFTPYRPTIWGLRAIWGSQGPRLTGSVALGQPGLLIRGSGGETAGLLLVVPDAYHLTVFETSLSAPLFRLRDGPVVRPSLGARLERWSAPGTPVRSVLGPQAGLGLEIAITKSLEATLEAQVGFTPRSPYRREDLPESFTPRTTWRRSVGVSLMWRL